MNKEITLNHPAWDKPRSYSSEHGENILELEKTRPSGIYQVQSNTSLDGVDDSTGQKNTVGEDNKAKANNPKGSKTGK